MDKKKKNENAERYRLHAIARKEGFRLATKKRTFYMYYLNQDISESVKALIEKYGYVIQRELSE